MTALKSVSILFLVIILQGCATRPINQPISQVEPTEGYRPAVMMARRQNNDIHTLFVLSFSGGGTRAAAFSYGVLEALNDIEFTVDGQNRRLIDEVDLITGVSGGSFTALAYALYGDRLFEEYEERFLKRNVQRHLSGFILNPFKWPYLWGSKGGRSELAADYYDEILFEGATYDDLLKLNGPVAIANGTDLSTGSRFAFFQNEFDLMCSDLGQVRLSRAAATSSAVPVALSPVTFNNYGGTCNYQPPPWVAAVTDPSNPVRPSARALKRWEEMESFQDSADRPYIHLVDGGVSDNIGVRGVMEAFEELAASAAFQGQVGFGVVNNIVLLVVNARSSPSTDWDKRAKPPGTISQLMQSSGVPIERYSFETIESMKDRVEIQKWRRELKVAQAQLQGMSKEEAEASVRNIDMVVLDVSFENVADPAERDYLMNQPTSFSLPAEAVDRLAAAGAALVLESPDYPALMDIFEKSEHAVLINDPAEASPQPEPAADSQP